MELPTIVLVVFDTARWDRFGCYGYGHPTTPTVDSLAKSGLRVETMIANAPWTLPSHGSLFTGLYPSQHGCHWGAEGRLRDNVTLTIAEWLRRVGYHTVCATSNGLISEATGLARGFDRYAFRLALERRRQRLVRRAKQALMGGDSGGRVVNSWLRRELASVEKPLFLFVNYVECHWPYTPPQRLERTVGGPRWGLVGGLKYRIGMATQIGPWEAIARADGDALEKYSTLYDAEHLNADGHLARLLEILSESGHFEEGQTLIVVTSDHGEHIGEHGLADHHASVDDHLIHVPFVAWGPGLIPEGTKRGVHEFVDVFASLCRLLGQAVPLGYLEGRRADLFQANGDAQEEEYAFAEWHSWSERELARLSGRNASYDFSSRAGDLVCVRNERFKLVRSPHGREALFDLATDPSEETDVAAANPEIHSRLRDRLDRAINSWRERAEGKATISEEESREIERHLEDLGYI